MINVAILTVNGAAAEGLAFDTSGPAIRDCLPPETFSVKQQQVVPEDKGLISAVVEKWCKPESDIQLVITTGGHRHRAHGCDAGCAGGHPADLDPWHS